MPRIKQIIERGENIELIFARVETEVRGVVMEGAMRGKLGGWNRNIATVCTNNAQHKSPVPLNILSVVCSA